MLGIRTVKRQANGTADWRAKWTPKLWLKGLDQVANRTGTRPLRAFHKH